MMKLTVKELKAMAKEMGLKGYSKLNKAELVELIEANQVQEVKEEKTACASVCKASQGCDASQGCPMVLEMLKSAGYSNGTQVKAGGKHNTPEKRRAYVENRRRMAEEQIIIDENTKLHIPTGNKKLQNVFNFPLFPYLTCPNATYNCMMRCYGFKNYFQPEANGHYRNFELSKKDNFVQIMFRELVRLSAQQKMENEILGTAKKITFRIHTVGDFYSYEYFEKWMEIVELCEKHNLPINFGAYTKSPQFVKAYLKKTGKKLKDLNINIMFSLWNDTPEKFLKMAEELEMNIFAVTEKTDVETVEKLGFERCPDQIFDNACGRICFKCYDKKNGNKKQVDGSNRKLIHIVRH